jgi:ATP-dependent DNA helicase RecQ
LGLFSLPQYGALRSHKEPDVIATVEALLASGKLVPKGRKYPTVWLAGKPVRSKSPLPKKPSSRVRDVSALARALANYRQKQARALRWKLYMVLTNEAIKHIETLRPKSLSALGEVKGIGPAKIERFGTDILAILKRHEDS